VPIHVVMDTQDPARIAPFWCELLGMQVLARLDGGRHLVLQSATDGFMLGLQRVPEARVGKNRVHLDVSVDDLDAGTAKVESLGGRWIEPGTVREVGGVPWRCMADPEGNEFCIYAFRSPAVESVPRTTL
jgi:predicted enzyme related to lactoylglutathione lyase